MNESPKHLSHQPIISVNNYSENDAMYANNTDAKALSIGKAQYDKNQITLKVWRHSGKKWSRQSEELPIHRNIDLSILFLAAISVDETSHYPKSNLREEIDSPTEVQKIKEYYEENKKFIEPRLKELKRLLEEIL
jgi:hypothetical protein